jgi:hypothetical protein
MENNTAIESETAVSKHERSQVDYNKIQNRSRKSC